MTLEDAEIWRQVTSGLVPLLPKPSAPVIRPDAPVDVIRPRARFTTLDLHGYTVHQACAVTKTFVYDAKRAGLKYVTIITGLSGQIRREFPLWVEQFPEVRKVDPANGGGAFRVYLKRNKRPIESR
jgi:dsDNA-specific endonuclease/ATPase MutS2